MVQAMSLFNQLLQHFPRSEFAALVRKHGRFKAGYKGQMELYPRSKDEEQIELLQLNQGKIRLAEYLTALPAKSILAAKLHDAVIRVREQFTRREQEREIE